MKINQPDYDRLKALVELVCEPYGGVEAVIQFRKEQGLVNNPVAIARWDIFHACCKLDTDLLKHLYDYLNDGHIETAMKAITDTK